MPLPRHTIHLGRLLAGTLAVAACLSIGASPAAARVVAEGVPDNPGSTRLTLTVDRGCAGSPTTALRVRLPAGAVDVHAQAPAGWTVEPAGAELVWTGDSLPDGEPAAFVTALRIPGMVGDVVYFPTVQRCGTLEETWTEPVADAGAAHAAPRIELRIAYLPDPPPDPTTAPPPPPTVMTDAAPPRDQSSGAGMPAALAGLLFAGLVVAVVGTTLVARRGTGGGA